MQLKVKKLSGCYITLEILHPDHWSIATSIHVASPGMHILIKIEQWCEVRYSLGNEKESQNFWRGDASGCSCLRLFGGLSFLQRISHTSTPAHLDIGEELLLYIQHNQPWSWYILMIYTTLSLLLYAAGLSLQQFFSLILWISSAVGPTQPNCLPCICLQFEFQSQSIHRTLPEYCR